ncbi:MAG: cation:proton antiporter [Bacteroidales bacterium]|nr:cation:proton antiporter [Bacteroidales bacterium]
MLPINELLLQEFKIPLQNPILVFALILLIILFSPIILKKLNIPSLIGLIISGVIIGPHGLNLLEKNFAVDLFSTIGLLYIMFIAGLELDLNEFIANRKKSIIFGFLTFAIPIGIGFPICYYWLGYNIIASFLISSMFATQTLVAYPIVSKLGVAKNEAVAITIGGTIFTDTAVLINLAIIKNINAATTDNTFWIALTISLIIFLIIMFFIIPRITKWFFQKLESEKYSHYIYVLFILFLSAFLSQLSGLEPIIGAFAAGIAMNLVIPHSSALMNRIEFIGNSLFIPFFLISVGMIIDVSVIFQGPTTILISAILIIIALFSKYLAALFTQFIFKYTATQRQLIFGLSSAHAAAILAFILVGYKAHIIDDTVFNGTIILILITCIVSSFVTEKAAKQLVIQGDSKIHNLGLNVWEYILIPIVNWTNLEKILRFAILLKDKKSPNPISLLTIVPNDLEAEVNIIKSRKKLEEYLETASSTETPVNIIVSIDHNAIAGILRTSKEIMANMLLIGWPKKADIFDKILGDNIEKLITELDKNIFLAHFEKPFTSIKRIILITPPLAEKEYGFNLWRTKILKIANELTVSIVHFGDIKTYDAISDEYKKKNSSLPITFIPFNEWEDFLILSKYIKNNDLIVLVSARKRSVSYINELENIPVKMDKYFNENNKIVVFPQQSSNNYLNLSYENIPTGMKTVRLVGKGISYIFKKQK